MLRRWADLMLAHQDDLGRLMTLEQGKALAEAKGEIGYAASFIEWFAEEAKRIDDEALQPQRDGQRIPLRKPVMARATNAQPALDPLDFATTCTSVCNCEPNRS